MVERINRLKRSGFLVADSPERLDDRFERFALDAIRLCRALGADYVSREMGKQFLRSAMSVGANWQEAVGGQSNAEFCHSANIAKKEARESAYWSALIAKSGLMPNREEALRLHAEATAIRRILATVILNAQQGRRS